MNQWWWCSSNRAQNRSSIASSHCWKTQLVSSSDRRALQLFLEKDQVLPVQFRELEIVLYVFVRLRLGNVREVGRVFLYEGVKLDGLSEKYLTAAST